MIGIISASTRPGRQSHNVVILIHKILSDRGQASQIIDLAHGEIPNFTASIAAHQGLTSEAKEVAELVDKSTGLIFVSPEYNGSYTGALKNLIDLCPKSYFAKKPIGISSVSSGGLAGMRGALQMQHLALAVFGIPSPSMLLVPLVTQKFDDNGILTDADFGTKASSFLDEYLWLHDKLV